MTNNRRFGKGDLYQIEIMDETGYGNTTGSAIVGGIMTGGLKIDPGLTSEEEVIAGSRRRGKMYLVGRDCTATVDFKILHNPEAPAEGSFITWLKWLLGTISAGGSEVFYGFDANPHSRTVHFRVSTYSWDTVKGAYLNRLTVTSEKIGAPLRFSADMFAKEYLPDNTYSSAATVSALRPLRCTAQWIANTPMQTIGVVPAKSWKLTFAQNLEKVPGADDDGVTNENGQEPYLGSPELSLEITTSARNRQFDLLRAAYTTDMTFSIRVGGYKLTLKEGVLDSAGTQRSPDPYDETITVHFGTFTIEDITE